MFSKTRTNSSTRGFILVLYQLDHTKSIISVHSVPFCSYLHSTVLSHYGRTYSLLRLSRPTDCQGSAGPSQAGTRHRARPLPDQFVDCPDSRLGSGRTHGSFLLVSSHPRSLSFSSAISSCLGGLVPGAPHTSHLLCRHSQRDTESNFILWVLLTGFGRRKVRAGRAVADSFLWPFSQLHLTLT